MELLWLRTRDIAAFGTAGNDAIDNGTLIRTDTGVSTRAIEQWDEKAAADKTWPNFQTHFETANLRRLEDLTAADAGLGGAHAANAAVTAPPTTPIASILPLKPLPPTLLTVAVIVGRMATATTPITPVSLAITKHRAIVTTPPSKTCLEATTPSLANGTSQPCTVRRVTIWDPTAPPVPPQHLRTRGVRCT